MSPANLISLRKILSLSLFSSLLVLVLTQAFVGQGADAKRVKAAVKHSKDSAATLKLITSLPEGDGIPAELFDRARLIGVFHVGTLNDVFIEMTGGFGAVSSRHGSTWSLPAIYAISSVGFKLKVGFKSSDIVILFMNDKATDWFAKRALTFKGERAGVAGPVGRLTPETRKTLEDANVIIYRFVNGKLKGIDMEGYSLNDSRMAEITKVNRSVYGLKGRELLLGKVVALPLTAPDVTAFSDVLNEKFPSR